MHEKENTRRRAFIVRNLNKDILKKSTSGGFFYAICEYVIAKKGIVFGAAINEHMAVVHRSAKTIEECLPFLGSKYVQSSLGNTFSEAEVYLQQGVLVCFSGTPCQIAGLKSYLRREYENLILVDLVCHGVLPAKMWEEYRISQEQKHKEEVKSAVFRSKRYGYQNSMMNLNFETHAYYGSSRIDPYLKTFYSNIALRPSCYECNFKGIDRVSDFTVYDCWNAHAVLGIKDDDAGYTNVIAHTDASVAILNSLAGIERHEVELDRIIPSTGGMVTKSAKRHPATEAFNKVYVEKGFVEANKKYLPITVKDRCIEKIKIMLRHAAVFRGLSKYKRELARKKK